MKTEKIYIDTLILGGGLAGIWAAHKLSKKKISNIVIEKEENIGGLIKTINYKNYKFDLGGHRLYFKDKQIENYIISLFDKNQISNHKRMSSIFYLNHILKYPPNFLDLIKNFKITLKILKQICKKHDQFSKLNNIYNYNFENYLVNKLGKIIYKMYFEEYSQKVWGIHPSGLDYELGERRIGNFSLIDLIFLRKNVKENTNFFYYPQNGIGKLIEILSKNLKIFKKTIPLYITKDKEIILSNNLKIKFNRLISTIPLTSLVSLFIKSKILAEKYINYLPYIKYRSLIIIFVKTNKEITFLKGNHWVYFPEKNIIFSRASNLEMWHKEELYYCAYTFEIFSDTQDYFWNLTDNALVKLIEENLKTFDKRLAIIDFKIIREKYAYPLLYKGYHKYTNILKNSLPQWVSTCGRTGEHSYYDIEEVINSVNRVI